MSLVEKDLLWDELGLESLLDKGPPAMPSLETVLGVPSLSPTPQFTPLQLREAKNKELKPLASLIEEKELAKQGMKKVMVKHKRMLDKPAYQAIMGRYQSLPNKPKVISKNKLSQLADPVLGKLSSSERSEIERVKRLQELEERAYQYLPTDNKTAAVHDEERELQNLYKQLEEHQQLQELRQRHPLDRASSLSVSPQRRNAKHGARHKEEEEDDSNGLFLTEARLLERAAASPSRDFLNRLRAPVPLSLSPHDKIDANIQASKNGFASLLRDRVQFAQRVNKLEKEHEHKQKTAISQNDVVSAYQRYAAMKRERERQIEEARKAARAKPPKLPPKMTKKVISRRTESDRQKETERKGEKLKERARSRSRGASLERKSDKVRESVSVRRNVVAQRNKRTANGFQKPPVVTRTRATQRERTRAVSSSVEREQQRNIADDGDDSQEEGDTFLTALLGGTSSAARVTLPPANIVTATTTASKLRSRLQNTVQNANQQSSRRDRLERVATRREGPERLRKDNKPERSKRNNEEERALETERAKEIERERETLASSSSAPAVASSSSKRAASRPIEKTKPQRTNSLPSLAQARQKASDPHQRLLQLQQQMLSKNDSTAVEESDFDEMDSLSAQNHYGKRRAKGGAASRLPPQRSGALRIPTMPREASRALSQDNKENKLEEHLLRPSMNVAEVKSSQAQKETASAQASSSLRTGAPTAELKDKSNILADVPLDKLNDEKDLDDDLFNDPDLDAPEPAEEKEDIHALISRLKKYEDSIQPKGTADLYVKPDVNASLYKHAERIGSNLSNIDAMMQKINGLRDGLELE